MTPSATHPETKVMIEPKEMQWVELSTKQKTRKNCIFELCLMISRVTRPAYKLQDTSFGVEDHKFPKQDALEAGLNLKLRSWCEFRPEFRM